MSENYDTYTMPRIKCPVAGWQYTIMPVSMTEGSLAYEDSIRFVLAEMTRSIFRVDFLENKIVRSRHH